MATTAFYRTPKGDEVLMSAAQLDVMHKVQEGDATCMWSGDSRMYVVWDSIRQKFIIERWCEDGRVREISTWLPHEFDSRVLVALGKGDTWNRDVLGEIEAQEARFEKEQATKAEEAAAEIADVINFIKRKYMSGSDE